MVVSATAELGTDSEVGSAEGVAITELGIGCAGGGSECRSDVSATMELLGGTGGSKEAEGGSETIERDVVVVVEPTETAMSSDDVAGAKMDEPEQ